MPRSLIGDLIRLILAALAACILVVGYTAFRIWQQGQTDESGHQAQAVVVLGAAQYDGVPSPVFAARIDHAIDLFHRGTFEWFVVTGGKQPGDRFTEAATAARYARARGVPAAAILSEDVGRDTYGSLRGVAALFRAHGIRAGMIVSDRTHLLRALRMADDLGLTAYGAPTPTSPLDHDPAAYADQMAHELGALALYLATR
ncbi:MAG TPA: YdcF family protein [Candidatus Limnocylindrales bacterium]|nr:YdcF family protein [Candidatus Limnocylindrales bacterium]